MIIYSTVMAVLAGFFICACSLYLIDSDENSNSKGFAIFGLVIWSIVAAISLAHSIVIHAVVQSAT